MFNFQERSFLDDETAFHGNSACSDMDDHLDESSSKHDSDSCTDEDTDASESSSRNGSPSTGGGTKNTAQNDQNKDSEPSAHDVWSDRFEELKMFKARVGHCMVPWKCPVNSKLGRWVGQQRRLFKIRQEGKKYNYSLTDDRVDKLNDIGFVWDVSKERSDDTWLGIFKQLEEFHVKEGHCMVPRKYSENQKLGRWVGQQRYMYKLYKEDKKTSLSEYRLKALESIGFDWSPSKRELEKRNPIGFAWNISKEEIEKRWICNFMKLKEFQAREGHCIVPLKYAENPTLGYWVSQQRHQHKLRQEGKTSLLSDEQLKALEKIGLGNNAWSVHFEELRQFKAREGHCVVPGNYLGVPKLGRWVTQQRYHYKLYHKGKKSLLTETRAKLLEDIGLVAKDRNTNTWMVHFQDLKLFQTETGHCIVPKEYSENPTLGNWACKQRYQCRLYHEGKKSIISEYRVKALAELGFSWHSSNDDVWTEHFEDLKKFKHKEGHCMVPTHNSENPTLGRWVRRQRYQGKIYNEGKKSPMTECRMKALGELGFSWHVKEVRKRKVLPSLEDWEEDHKDCGHVWIASSKRIKDDNNAWMIEDENEDTNDEELQQFKCQNNDSMINNHLSENKKLIKLDEHSLQYKLQHDVKKSSVAEDEMKTLEENAISNLTSLKMGR